MKKLNKKGFTLVELLAVIVILALLMVVATRTIGTTMTNSRVAAIQTEAQKLFSKTYEEAQTIKLLGDINNGTTQAYSYGKNLAAGTTYGTLTGTDGDYNYKIVVSSSYEITSICVFDSKQKKGYASNTVTTSAGDMLINGTTLSFNNTWKDLTACP